MKLYQIIEVNDSKDLLLSYESIHQYLKSLYVYYKDEFRDEPVLLVDSIMNAVQYVKIVDCETFTMYLNDLPKEEAETINFNSRMLVDLIK